MNHDMNRNDQRLKLPVNIQGEKYDNRSFFFTFMSSRVRLGRLPLGKRKVHTSRCSLLAKSSDESRIVRNFLPSTLSRHSKMFTH
jgi:hypothetical protein